jgi:hypothetical protein
MKKEDALIQTVEMLKVFSSTADAIASQAGAAVTVNISARPNLDAPLGDPAMGGHASLPRFGLARPGVRWSCSTPRAIF